MQSSVGELQRLEKTDSAYLKKHMEEERVNMCQQLGTLRASRVEEAREDHIRESIGVSGPFVQCLKNCLKRIKQHVQESPCVRDAQAEKLGPGFGDNDGSNNALTCAGEFEFNIGTAPSFV